MNALFNIALAESEGKVVDVEPWELRNALTEDIKAREEYRRRENERVLKELEKANKRRERKEGVQTFLLMFLFMVFFILLPLFFG